MGGSSYGNIDHSVLAKWRQYQVVTKLVIPPYKRKSDTYTPVFSVTLRLFPEYSQQQNIVDTIPHILKKYCVPVVTSIYFTKPLSFLYSSYSIPFNYSVIDSMVWGNTFYWSPPLYYLSSSTAPLSFFLSSSHITFYSHYQHKWYIKTLDITLRHLIVFRKSLTSSPFYYYLPP